MLTSRPTILVAAAATLALSLTGCPNASGPSAKGNGKGDEHAHEHDHAHHGPHHGHLMEIGEEEYHAEWTHDDKSGKVTFYILDSEAKKEVPIDAEAIKIDVKIGENAPSEFTLAAVNPQDGKSSQFEATDQQLVGVLETLKSKSVVATLHVTINGKAFAQRIQEHEH